MILSALRCYVFIRTSRRGGFLNFHKKIFSLINQKLISLFVFLFIFSTVVFSQEKLVLIGGGKRPPEAVRKMVEWAGGEKAKVLVITWASGVPAESFEGVKKDFAAYKTASFENAPIAPLDTAEREAFLAQLKTASAIFFTGGDQNRIMDVLQDAELYNALREKYKTGAVFGGTSAGTAVMSDPMMTGESDLKSLKTAPKDTRRGLGLLPDVILDQHFIIRQRQNRLFGLVLQTPEKLGIGIDEDTALLVEDNRRAEVVGATQVMFVDGKTKNATFQIHLLKSGEVFDLTKRKIVSKAKSQTN